MIRYINSLKKWQVLSCYFLLILLLLVFVDIFLYEETIFTEKNLIHFDAVHYLTIKNEGYQGFLTAFFPLFPIIWKISFLNIYGITIFNGLLFILSVYFLSKVIEFRNSSLLLVISTPSFIFFFLPYSESLFFFLSSLLIYLILRTDKKIWIYLCLLILGLIRPTSFFLLFALFISSFFFRKSTKDFFQNAAILTLICLFTVFALFSIHYIYTGNFFIYFEISKSWGGILQIPKLPFTSWGGGIPLRLDGASLVFGIISLCFAFKTLKKKDLDYSKENQVLIISFLYVGIITFFILIRGGTLI
jgi:hypothetical protein